VAVEGDWPDCFRLHPFVKDAPRAAGSPREALKRFQRWPTWMWANREVEAVLGELRDVNDAFRAGASRSDVGPRKVGFYGLDVYSLFDSMDRLAQLLGEVRPEAVEAARRAWACFEPYGEDAQRYALATQVVPTDCRNELAELLAVTRESLMSLP